MGGVYLTDSWDDHSNVKAAGPEFARIMTERIRAQTKTLFHMLGQSQIHLDGDEAGVETYFLAVSRDTNAQGIEVCNQLGGRFVDNMRHLSIARIAHMAGFKSAAHFSRMFKRATSIAPPDFRETGARGPG